MTPPKNIFLVGPMGAGKTTVGRHLARALGKDFVDCDAEIESSTGASIPLIFELEGEPGFRKRERSMIHSLTAREGVVLATGGGAVLEEENRNRLRSLGFTVYLKAPIDLLVERTSKDRSRPLLQTPDPRARLTELIAHREPLYEQVADLVIHTNYRTAKNVAKDVVRRLQGL